MTTLTNNTNATGELFASALLKGQDGNFYGTGGDGGETTESHGTVFRITPTGTVTNLHNFTGADGSYPIAGLVQGSGGNFYGTTSQGGTDGYGTVFEITPEGGFKSLHSFNGTDGDMPGGTLIEGPDGDFYGTTQSTVFKISPAGSFTLLYTFNGYDGSDAEAGLIAGGDGNFYGTTRMGGASGAGTVFRITPAGDYLTLYSFDGYDGSGSTDGSGPLASLVLGSDGFFYGTTVTTGVNGPGTIFRVSSTGEFTNLHNFDGTDGQNPAAALVAGSDGNFYGTTEYGGTLSGGTIFRVTPAGAVTTLYNFSGGADGGGPISALTPDGDNLFYGTTQVGSGNNDGTIFTFRTQAAASVTPTVKLVATIPVVTLGSGGFAEFTLRLLAAQTSNITVSYTIKGTAINGKDYELLKATKEIKAGETSVPIKIVPRGNLEGAAQKLVVLKLSPGHGYKVGTTSKVKVKILH